MANLDKTVVLVADDEPSTLALVSSHLRSKGYKVLEAVDGDQAWELAHEHLPHVVVLDVMMPGMSGWEVCRKIREAVSLAHTGVVMLTGIGENLNEMTSPLYGADAYLDKPFEFSELDRKIKETLSRRRGGAFGRPDSADVVLERREKGNIVVTSSASPHEEVTEEVDTAWDTKPTVSVRAVRPKPAAGPPPRKAASRRRARDTQPSPAPAAPPASRKAGSAKRAAPAAKAPAAKAQKKAKPAKRASAKAGKKLAASARTATKAARRAVKAVAKATRKPLAKPKRAAGKAPKKTKRGKGKKRR